MCHSCVSRNPASFPRKRERREHGLLLFSGFLDSRFRGNDTLALARQGRGELLHSAKISLPDAGIPGPQCFAGPCNQASTPLSGIIKFTNRGV